MSAFFYEKDLQVDIIEEGKVKRIVKAYNENIMMVEVFFENGGIGAVHSHPHEQTTYCLEGEFIFNIDGVKKTITVGDTIYMKANSVHGCTLNSTKGRVLDVFTPCRQDFLK